MFWNHAVAYKYKMSSMQAALGRVQLEGIEELMTRKRQLFASYEARRAGVRSLTRNEEPPGTAILVQSEKSQPLSGL